MTVKINTLEVENVKRIKAVQLDCTGQALTVIGGNNGEGKTSVLDAIAYALGGEKYRPTNIKRDDSIVPPEIRLTLSNGIKVERKGKKSNLTVTDPNGGRSGQALLNEFVHQFALDLPKFLEASEKAKAETLLKVIGVGDDLARIEREAAKINQDRKTAGQLADSAFKHAESLPYYPDAPEAPTSAAALIDQHRKVMEQNAKNGSLRAALEALKTERGQVQKSLAQLQERLRILDVQITQSEGHVLTLTDQDPETLRMQLDTVEETNAKVRANLDKEKAMADAEEQQSTYATLTKDLEAKRAEKAMLFKGADMPLDGLEVVDGALAYNGHPWDSMSGAEQLMVATAIVRKLNPECGFVLLDKLEQMDMGSLAQFATWLENEGLQAIATRVSTGSECSIIIEDGTGIMEPITTKRPTFTPGSF